MQDRGLLIVGTQRSGTTLLNRILNAHPDVALLFQQSNFLRLDPRSYDLRTAGETTRLINDAKAACSVYSSRFDDRIKDSLLLEFNDAGQPTVGAVYRSVMTRLLPKTATRYWGEKYAGRMIDALKFIDIVPDGKIVHIVRDPRDVCASEKRRLAVQMAKPDNDTSFLLTAYDWKIAHFIGRYIERVLPDNYLVLKYEDLITSPEQACERICRFLNLPFAPEMLASHTFTDDDGSSWEANSFFESNVTTVRPDFVGRWPRILTQPEASFVERFCEAGMRDFGYPVQSSPTMLASLFSSRGELRRLGTAAERYARACVKDPAYRPYVPQRFNVKIDFEGVDPLYAA